MRAQLFAIAAALGLMFAGIGSAQASGDTPEAPDHDWQHTGVFGTFDRGSVQRGLQVYLEVCASCHSLKLVTYRNLSGIGLKEDQIKTIAALSKLPKRGF